mmetsp:Transcript_21056/g.48766  ORF Transcript_21056/g.48766 Transcript_21056/m.48766 type:complete len:1366 (-) Transcript_21056:196-4293(-)
MPAKENVAPDSNVDKPQQLRRGKTIEEIYQKKTQLEHILLRPDTYVGSCEHQHQDLNVFDEKKGEIVNRKIDYVPALYKIFDEILVNAADNAMRDKKGMDRIEVNIDKEAGSISVLNNGKGIPVQVHKEHKCYVPELIFGHLLTSDNYDDNEQKVTGGRNGYGAKLTNVFSKKFIVETADKSVKKKFSQTFENNMTVKNKPKISDYNGEDYTKVTFWPDFSKFGMTGLDNDIVSLMMKRAYDVAGSTSKKVKVHLNGSLLQISDFEGYVQLHVGDGAEGGEGQGVIYERCNENWEIAFAPSDSGFQQVSFVNSINTIKGGTHVTYITDQLVEEIMKVVKSKNRGGMDIKPQHVKNHLKVFVNALIVNPAFDSQTKETLTTKASKFGSTCEIPAKMMKQIMKSGVVENILDWVRTKQKVDMGRQLKGAKNVTRVLGIPKLEDANDAGTKNSEDCTLILTEGDSAKALAVAGLAVVGRDKYGVFPLKGKVLNVRDANFKQMTGNTEIQNLLKILGLDTKREYESVKGLRYGSIMLMTDQDHDGSHIKGLIINLVHFWWPSLVKMEGFVKEFATPIIKVWKEGKKDSERKDEKCFFSIPEYEKWKNKATSKGWKTKYYKGLGTSTAKEAKEYFKDIEHHELAFQWKDDVDGEAIDLAFNKKRADDRKQWINDYQDGDHVDHTKSTITYYDFVHKELVQFAKYDVQRSVPSVVDGFKPSQRKVLFAAFKKKLKSDIKVAQFVGYISEHSAYHHGEASLENTIINLAQNFVGSNNINLLVPSGQFGTRLQGGKDHAASRYIFTRLAPVTRKLFPADDDAVLDYLNEEGQSIEPKWYCPIIPLVLVNGADGIGTGWSSTVPNYNPRDIIRNIRKMLRGEKMEEMSPWYKGFTGSVVASDSGDQRFDVIGNWEKKSDTTLEITELPIKTWTQNYKETLEEMLPKDGGKKGEEGGDSILSDFREHHTENTVHFELTLSADKMKQVEKSGVEKTFKLKGSIATSNMTLFDAEGKIVKYASALDILKDFCKLRRQMYGKRKDYLVAKLTREKEILSNKARFILMVVEGKLELRKRKKADLLNELQKLKFKPMSELDAILEGKSKSVGEEGAAPAGETGGDDAEKSDYDYLLGMNLWSLTYERVEEIRKLFETKTEELNTLLATSLETLWDRDLQSLAETLDEIDRMEEEEQEASASAMHGRKRKDASKQSAGAAKKAKVPAARSSAKPEDKKLLSKPLQDTARADVKVERTVWGGGAPKARPETQAAAAQESEKAEEKEAPKEESGSGMLSRILSKTKSGLGGAMPSLSLPTSAQPTSLSSSDFFSYVKGGSTDTSFNALDGGIPPLTRESASAGSTTEAASGTADAKRRKVTKG